MPLLRRYQRPQQRQHTVGEYAGESGIRLERDQASEARELRVDRIGDGYGFAHCRERGPRLVSHRQIERRVFGEALRARRIDPDQGSGIFIEPGIEAPVRARSGSAAIPQFRLDERHDGLAATGRQVQPIQRRRQEFGRRRFEIEQQAQRVGQIDLGKLVEYGLAVHAAVEQAGQNRAAQQGLPPIGIEIQDRTGEAREQNPRQVRIERADQRHDVAVFLFQCSSRIGAALVIVGQAHEHAGELGRVVDEQREIDQ